MYRVPSHRPCLHRDWRARQVGKTASLLLLALTGACRPTPAPPAATASVADTAESAQLAALAARAADAAAQQQGPAPSPGADGAAGAAAAAPLTPELLRSAAIYAKLCALCHGKDREGYAADNAPSLKSSTFLESADDTFLRAAIVRGRPGTAMAGFAVEVGGPLSAAEIDGLMRWLRHGGPPRKELAPATLGDAEAGRAIYDTSCASCHGTVAQRGTAVHLANSQLLATAGDAYLRHAIVHGRPGTPMVAFGERLGDKGVADVLAWLRAMATAPPPMPAQPLELPPAPPRTGPIVLNPQGKPADLKLKDDRLASLDDVHTEAFVRKRRIIFADARAPSDWMQLHIRGAVSTPYYQLDSLNDLPNDGTWIIAYCACPHHASGVVVDELRKRGYKHTAVLDEGVFAWERKGYPVVKDPNTPTIAAPPPPGAVMPAAPGAGAPGHDHHGHAHPH